MSGTGIYKDCLDACPAPESASLPPSRGWRPAELSPPFLGWLVLRSHLGYGLTACSLRWCFPECPDHPTVGDQLFFLWAVDQLQIRPRLPALAAVKWAFMCSNGRIFICSFRGFGTMRSSQGVRETSRSFTTRSEDPVDAVLSPLFCPLPTCILSFSNDSL